MALTPPLIAAIILLGIPPLTVVLAGAGRWITGWLRLAAAFPLVSASPPNAHRVSGQSVGLTGRPRLWRLCTVAVSDDAVWLTVGGPFALFYPPIQVPLASITMRANDAGHGDAELLLGGPTQLSLSLGGDGAQLVIARLG